LGFMWDLCFGDGELPSPELPNLPPNPPSVIRVPSYVQSVEMT
jgi:hypothetical protein